MSLRALRADVNNVAVEWPLTSRRRFGVPIGGPFDAVAFRLALSALGQVAGKGMEVGFFGGEWEAEEDLVLVHFGCLRSVKRNGQRAESDLFAMRPGERIEIGRAKQGHRSYLVHLPFRAEDGQALHRARIARFASSTGPIRVISAASSEFFDLDYLVTPRINRLGLRLATTAALAHETELPSEPQCFGAIQITPDGTPLIIGPDGPTLGGYPKAGTLASVDLPRLAQLRPGDRVRFERVDYGYAKSLLATSNRVLENRCRELRTAIRLNYVL